MQSAAISAARDYYIVGIQETRLQARAPRYVGECAVFHLAATPAGTEGCAVWIWQQIEYMP
eukprot:1545874-Pyramimonas_sp.AAC.1